MVKVQIAREVTLKNVSQMTVCFGVMFSIGLTFHILKQRLHPSPAFIPNIKEGMENNGTDGLIAMVLGTASHMSTLISQCLQG
jgi:hypothetical protein